MPYTFSPSSLSLLKDCPRCFWLQFKKGIKRPASIFPSLPSGMDKVLKEHFDRFMMKEEIPPELKELKGIKLFSDVSLLKTWRNNLKGIEWYDDSGNKIHGAIDNLLDKDGTLVVLDYKTRGFPLKEDTHEHYKDQLDIYNFLLRKKGHATEDYAYLLFYHPTRVLETGEVVFHTDLIKIEIHIKNAEKIITKALDILSKEMPERSKECEFCRYASL